SAGAAAVRPGARELLLGPGRTLRPSAAAHGVGVLGRPAASSHRDYFFRRLSAFAMGATAYPSRGFIIADTTGCAARPRRGRAFPARPESGGGGMWARVAGTDCARGTG